MRVVIYCADVGSVARGRFGWARSDVSPGEPAIEPHRGGTEIVELVEAVAADLESERAVALGFECPLYVPVPEPPLRLGAARAGEGNRSWSAGAGAGVLATGVAQVSWILDHLRRRTANVPVHLDWHGFARSDHGRLFLWEAFVSERAKAATHVDDASVAVAAFRQALPDPTAANAVTAERPLSLLGAALLWSGWTNDIERLHAACLVIKALPPAAGEAEAAIPSQDQRHR